MQDPRPTATQTLDPTTTLTPPAEREIHGLYRAGLAYGRLVHRLRWVILVLWLVGVAAAIPFAARVSSVLTSGGYSYNNSESFKAQNLISGALAQPPSSLLVVFQSPDATTNDPDFQNEVSAFGDAARAFPHVTAVTSLGTGADGRTTAFKVDFNQSNGYVEQHLASFRALLPTPGPNTPARAYLTGEPAVSQEFSAITSQDTEMAELAALPIALFLLLIVFGTLVSAFTPLLLAAVSVPAALALVYAIAQHSSISIFVLNISSIVGLGIAIDYSLFMTRRFRSELAHGRTTREAVAWTVATAGEAILFSGLTVMIGFIGMLLIGIQLMTSLAVGGALVVAAAVVASLTLLPALLSVLGPRANALDVPVLGKLVWRAERESEDVPLAERRGFWQTWARAVMRRPVVTLVLVAAVLLGIGWPVLSINVGTPGTDMLPPNSPSRQGLAILNQQFPATSGNLIQVVVQSPDGSSILTHDNLIHLANLTEWLNDQNGVAKTTGLMRVPVASDQRAPSEPQLLALYTTGAYSRVPGLAQLVAATTHDNTTLITLTTNAAPESQESKALVNHLRAGDQAAGGGLRVFVGGDQATSLDFTSYLYGNFPRAILFILAATFVLLLLMFRSVLLPLKAILMNVLSVSAAFGVLVWVFQWGHFSSLLSFTSDGVIDSIVPILMFCVLFGLSMDYEVFLLSRIREEWLRTHNNRWAVARGMEQTGGVITNAALLFVIVTGAFTFTRLVVTKEIGLGMTVAVLVDAAVIRMLLVPATMRLLGRWNWWLPGRPLPPKQVG